MYEIFAKLLKQHGITPYRVSKETGVSQGSLSDWKNGKSKPKYDKLQKIADYFGVSVDYLLGNEQKKEPAQNVQAEKLDPAFFRVMKSAQEKGYSPHDIELAMNFIKQARERDKQ